MCKSTGWNIHLNIVLPNTPNMNNVIMQEFHMKWDLNVLRGLPSESLGLVRSGIKQPSQPLNANSYMQLYVAKIRESIYKVQREQRSHQCPILKQATKFIHKWLLKKLRHVRKNTLGEKLWLSMRPLRIRFRSQCTGDCKDSLPFSRRRWINVD